MKRVLVVDDSEVVLAMARSALEKKGFNVVTACNGMDANRHLFGHDQPDIIVLDVMIPLLKGDKVAKLIKENKHIKNLPILLISSKPEDELRRMAAESGADGFLQKPFSDQALVDKVELMTQPGR